MPLWIMFRMEHPTIGLNLPFYLEPFYKSKIAISMMRMLEILAIWNVEEC